MHECMHALMNCWHRPKHSFLSQAAVISGRMQLISLVPARPPSPHRPPSPPLRRLLAPPTLRPPPPLLPPLLCVWPGPHSHWPSRSRTSRLCAFRLCASRLCASRLWPRQDTPGPSAQPFFVRPLVASLSRQEGKPLQRCGVLTLNLRSRLANQCER